MSTGLSVDAPCTCMAIVPPLLSRSGLLEVGGVTSYESLTALFNTKHLFVVLFIVYDVMVLSIFVLGVTSDQ